MPGCCAGIFGFPCNMISGSQLRFLSYNSLEQVNGPGCSNIDGHCQEFGGLFLCCICPIPKAGGILFAGGCRWWRGWGSGVLPVDFGQRGGAVAVSLWLYDECGIYWIAGGRPDPQGRCKRVIRPQRENSFTPAPVSNLHHTAQSTKPNISFLAVGWPANEYQCVCLIECVALSIPERPAGAVQNVFESTKCGCVWVLHWIPQAEDTLFIISNGSVMIFTSVQVELKTNVN